MLLSIVGRDVMNIEVGSVYMEGPVALAVSLHDSEE